MTSARPGAFLALWNGVNDPALRAEYEAWHTFEHVPERVGLPGFRWARRYVALAQDGTGGANAQPAYFTLYGLATLEALRTPAYQDVLDHPTAWSARMRGVLSDFCREPCDSAAFHGNSNAAQLATLRLRLPEGDEGAALAQCLRALVDEGHAVRSGWGRVDTRSGHPLDSDAACRTPVGADVVVLLEHLRMDLLQAAVDRLSAALEPALAWRGPPGFFQFQSTVHQAGLAHPLTARQPARPDIRQRFQPGDELP